MRAKRSDVVLVALVVLAAWNPQIQWPNVLPLPITGPVTRVIVLYVSEAPPQEAVKLASITGGATARALREAGKWRLWDTQSVPDGAKPLLDSAKSLPWCAVLHGDRVTFQGPLPKTEGDLAKLVADQGGIK
jgi:hypothetical protein